MLNLKRRAGEIIMIGEDIQLKVIGINGQTVMLGVHAPKNVPVHRYEIYQKIKIENNRFDSPLKLDHSALELIRNHSKDFKLDKIQQVNESEFLCVLTLNKVR